MDTSIDVKIMPASVYKSELKKLAPSNLEIGTYTTNTVKIVGSLLFYLVHLDTRKLQEVTFYVARNDGSVLLSCTTTLVLGLIQPHTRLYYLPPRASLITSSLDHPRKTKKVPVQRSKKEVCAQSNNQAVAKQLILKLDTNKKQILQSYPYVFEGIGSVNPKQTSCRPIPVHLKESLQQAIDKMLKAGVLKPVHEATPWINGFVLVEVKDKLGNLKLRIFLDPTNLNKVIVREPYHFKTLEGIAHLLADAYIMSVCDCKKGYWHKSLMKLHPFLQLLTLSLGNLDVL